MEDYRYETLEQEVERKLRFDIKDVIVTIVVVTVIALLSLAAMYIFL